jgi:hypothetical protein
MLSGVFLLNPIPIPAFQGFQTMTMKGLRISITLILAVLILMLAACRKEEQESIDTEILIENAVADNVFTDVSGIADEAYSGNLESYRSSSPTLSACASISIDTSASTRTMSIDFGTSNCLCADGNYRRGTILVTWTGAYRDSGSVHTIGFANYFVNDNGISGSKTVTNLGTNAAGNLHYSVVVNGSITWSSQSAGGGGTSTHSSTRTREWIAGVNTPSWLDDVYLIGGTASGVSRRGTAFTLNTLSPLRKEIGFRHFTQGVLAFTPGNLSTRNIDYGYVNGGRDNLARVTVNGQSVIVQLR